MTSEKYQENSKRVYDIQNIPKKLRGIVYDIHHIVQRCDLGVLVPLDFDIDAISNLFPILKEDHKYINDKIRLNEMPVTRLKGCSRR